MKFLKTLIVVLISSLTMIGCNTKEEQEKSFEQEDTSGISEMEADEQEEETSVESDSTETDIPKGKNVPLTIYVNNLKSKSAPIVVQVYKSKGKFLYKEAKFREYTFIPNGTTLTDKITDLEYGEYALAIFQDINGNGKLDKNRIGLPSESYAFSTNHVPTVRLPDYTDCKFNYSTKHHKLAMKLIK